MTTLTNPTSAYADSKSHYQILDGLRGVAALTVVIFHILEIFSGGDHQKQIINHGYLAVDFFFMLSGYVIGYAYDDRWGKMTLGDFLKRRLIRLHPMIVFGMVVGAIGFYFSASPILFPGISEVPVWQLILVMLYGCTLLPLWPGADIRGWAEMHPLNGPAWSLFFEYIANILYATVIRRFSDFWLSVVVFVSGAALIHLAVTSEHGDVIGGWSLDPHQLHIGFTRLFFPFFAGLLLSRVTRPASVKQAFLWCSILLLGVLAFPRVGEQAWANGLYDSLSIIFIFPLIVYIGASGQIHGKAGQKICQFLGDISYPIYITHYPIIYVFSAWAVDQEVSMQDSVGVSVLVFVSSVALAYAALKLYDIPTRKWLTARFVSSKTK